MRKRITWLSLLIVALSLVLAACGEDDDMGGMDMGGGDSEVEATSTMAMDMSTPMASATEGMNMDMGGSPEAAGETDLIFIDSMIEHHSSAIMMAEIALEESEREEIQQLSEEIISAQEAEIEQLREWRDEWYPDAPQTDMSVIMETMDMGDMGGMGMGDDAMQMLRDAEDFDIMFIDMMTAHHESAIEMARDIQETTERPELQQLADEIITAQQAEIDQMREWRAEWAS